MVRKLLLVAVALFIVSCTTQTIRYSPYELQEFSPETQEHIKRSEIAIGMSQQAVRYSLGGPADIRVEESDSGNYTETWIYTRSRIMLDRLTFVDGKLIKIVSGMGKRKNPFSFGRNKSTDNQSQGTAQGSGNTQ
jgi:hypothetical protein